MIVRLIPVVIGALGTITERFVQGVKDSDIRGLVETIEATPLLRWAQKTEINPGDLRRLADTKTSVENHLLV